MIYVWREIGKDTLKDNQELSSADNDGNNKKKTEHDALTELNKYGFLGALKEVRFS